MAPLQRRQVLRPADLAPDFHERPCVAFEIRAAHVAAQGSFHIGQHDDVLHGHDRAEVIEELFVEHVGRV